MAAKKRPAAIDVTRRNDIGLVTLDRPHANNALDRAMTGALTDALRMLDGDPRARAVVLLGAGDTFCAGADDRSMTSRADGVALATLCATLAGLAKPTIARIHGDAIGVGVGLAACCDIAVAAHQATFRLPETKRGQIPAVIAPYLVEAIGARQARRYALTGERFDAAEAYRIGLVHDIVPTVEALDGRVNELLGELLAAGPQAMSAVKALVRSVAQTPIDARLVAETAKRGADVAASDEGREGVAALRAERMPSWLPLALRKAR